VTRARALVLAASVLAGAACGKYGPPVRAAAEPVPKTTTPPAVQMPGVSAAPRATSGAAANTEECPDPNAPAATAGSVP
jgi:hypothetical protein